METTELNMNLELLSNQDLSNIEGGGYMYDLGHSLGKATIVCATIGGLVALMSLS